MATLPRRHLTASKQSHESSTPPRTWPHMGGQALRLVTWLVESNRREWEIGPRSMPGTTGVRFAEQAQPAQPWTGVNNCAGVPWPLPPPEKDSLSLGMAIDSKGPGATHSSELSPHLAGYQRGRGRVSMPAKKQDSECHPQQLP